jgi:hypothetical protein
MQDMIAIGETWFEQQRRKHLAVEVEYRPLVGAARTVKATVVVGRWETVDAAGQMIRSETRDWFVHRSELAQDPKKGDRIVTTEYGTEVIYEVSIPGGAEHHWRWSDRNQNLRRIHTQVVQGALDRRPSAPGAPTSVAATNLNPVSWIAPTATGGSPITSYRVYVNGALADTVAAPATTTATGYSVGAIVQVSAVNAVGEGPKSAPATVAATLPGAPTILQFSSSTALYWVAGDEGGVSLTGYKLFRNGVLVEVGESWVSSSATVYEAGSVMTLLAINEVGEGPLSAPVTVT